MRGKLQAVLVEHDERRAERFRSAWREILQTVYPDIDVRLVHSIQNEDDILRDRPHIVIVDNVFPDKNGFDVPNMGVSFIVKFKNQYPDTIFILFTGATFEINQLNNRIPNPDLIVPKAGFSSSAYQVYLASLVRRRLKRAPHRAIVFTKPRERERISDFYPHFCSIIEQCLAPFQNPDLDDAINEVHLTALGGGLSGAHIFRAKLYGTRRYENAPFVLKIDRSSDVEREIMAYNCFVRLQLPHDMRVDLAGTGRTSEFSGALYAFAFGAEEALFSLTDLLSEEEDEKRKPLESLIDHLFRRGNIGWYKESGKILDLEHWYNNSSEYHPEKDGRRIEQLNGSIREFLDPNRFGINADNVWHNDVRLKFPRALLSRFIEICTPQCICHGDLNSNNVFLNGKELRIALIDFEYAGHDIWCKDFVSLEISVRAYCQPDTDDFMKILERERELRNSEATDSKESQCGMKIWQNRVITIREAAFSMASSLECENVLIIYELAVSFHLLKVAGLPGWSSRAFVGLLAALVASLERLEELSSNFK